VSQFISLLDQLGNDNECTWVLQWLSGDPANQERIFDRGCYTAPTVDYLSDQEKAQIFDWYFDLASLTKVMLTSSLFLREFELSKTADPKVFYASKLLEYIPELKSTALENVTLIELLEHRSGLAAWKNCFEPARKDSNPKLRDEQWQEALQAILSAEMTETGQSCYSDLGYMLLGLYLERKKQKKLDTQWMEFKESLSMAEPSLCFLPDDQKICVPTEIRHKRGQVNDDNTFSLAGISSHAGLWGRLIDCWNYLCLLNEWIDSNKKLAFYKKIPQDHKNRFYYGWDRATDPSSSSAGTKFPDGVIGHLGYTGTALWWDPAGNRAGILLSNRVYPQATNRNKELILKVRRAFFDDLWQNDI